MSERFTYYVIYRDRQQTLPGTVVTKGRLTPDHPARTVGWHRRARAWTDMGNVLSTKLADEDELVAMVDRATAERVVRETLGQELPSEEELQAIGDRADQEIRQTRGRTGG